MVASQASLSSQLHYSSNSKPFWGHKTLDLLIRLVLCALSGLLLCLGCIRPGLWFFAWIGFLPLFVALLNREGLPVTKHPFAYGCFTGIVGIGGGFYWILPFLGRFGELPISASIPIFLLFAAYHGLVFALFAWLLCYLRRELDVPITCLAGLCWVTCEFIFPCIFPWYLALTQARIPLVIQIADITGPVGVSFLLAISSGALFDLGSHWMRKKRFFSLPMSSSLGFLVILFALVYGGIRLVQIDQMRSQAPKIRLGFVQPNIGMDIKFISNPEEQFKKLHESSKMLESQGADLIVWPESAYPAVIPKKALPLIGETNPNDSEHHFHMQRQFQTPLLFGALTVDQQGYYNTALMMNREGNITGIFDKNFLLIFGEYVPFWEHLRFIKKWIPNVSSTTPGTATTTFPFEYQGKSYFLGPMICYEDIIPAFGRRLFDTPNPPNLLINITNDAWFGKTEEPYEHLGLSIFRAIEHREDLVRVTNTGVSAFIDAAGRVYDETPSFDPQGAYVPPVARINSAALLAPGGFYQRLGDTFAVACLTLVIFFTILVRHRSGRPIRFLLLLGSAAFLHLVVLLLSLLSPGTSLTASYAAFLHREEAKFPESEIFQASWILLVGLAGSSLVLGAVLEFIQQRRLTRDSSHAPKANARLEILGALLCVTVLPVFFWGRMEGNTGAVVIVTVICGLFALLGETITLWMMRKKSAK